MANEEDTMPERTDRVIPGAMKTSDAMEPELSMNEFDETNPSTATATTAPVGTTTETQSRRDKVVAKVSETRQKVATEAAGKTRGLVGDGLSKSSETIGNMSRLVDETAANIDEQLGSEYGDYARKTARYLDDTAQRIAAKDPDELVDDVRGFVRQSPAMALGAAAIVGFAIARLVGAGFDAERENRIGDDYGNTTLRPVDPAVDSATAPVDPVVTPRI